MGNPLAGFVPLVEVALPWRDVRPMDVKMRISEALRSGGFAFHELCAFLRISRKTGYKWVRRWEEQRQAGLKTGRVFPARGPNECGRTWRSSAAPAGEAEAKMVASRATRTGQTDDVAPELGVDSGLQGSVHDAGRGVVLPVDSGGWFLEVVPGLRGDLAYSAICL